MRTLQRRRVVDPVAGDRHNVSLAFERIDDPAFLICTDASEDDFRRVQRQTQLHVGQRAQPLPGDYQWIVGTDEPDLAPDRPRGKWMVAGDHDYRDAGFAALAERLRDLRTGRIFQAGKSRENKIFLDPGALPLLAERPVGHRDHAQALRRHRFLRVVNPGAQAGIERADRAGGQNPIAQRNHHLGCALAKERRPLGRLMHRRQPHAANVKGYFIELSAGRKGG